MNLVLQISDKLDSITAHLIDEEKSKWIEETPDKENEDGFMIDRDMRIISICEDGGDDWNDEIIPGKTLKTFDLSAENGSFMLELENQAINKIFIGVSC